MHTKAKRLVFIIVSMLLLGGGVLVFYKASQHRSVFPDNIVHNSGFAVYYPTTLPAGYSLDTKSVRSENGIIFYRLTKGANSLTMSEQAAPANPPDFDALKKLNSSFKQLDLDGGKALLGIDHGLPVAIVATNTTMINISASKDVPLDLVNTTARKMSPLL